ncbi:MAG: FAD-dependent oxidoreductase [Pseudomonadota bacterium]
MTAAIHRSGKFDTVIIGGGVLGLWAGRHAIKRNERVLLLEKRKIGSGASGGFLGALMPHMPDSWNRKKQFQFDGLTSLAETVAELEKETGIDCGYRRCARLMPLPHEKLLPQVQRRIDGANEYWQGKFQMRVDDAGQHSDWLSSQIARYGVQHDTISARINPRAYVSALEAFVRQGAEVQDEAEVVSIECSSEGQGNAGGIVHLSDGQKYHAEKIIIANGWEAYNLLQPMMGQFNDGQPLGRGVKGQAVLVQYDHDDTLPIIYHDGTYIVPHSNNRIAIGSTSINDWQTSKTADPSAFDPDDLWFYQKALNLVPALTDAPIIERWAGVRPRNTLKGRGTEPWFGPVPDYPGLIALIGGFKITLGIAHMPV